nr:hypothetical protein [Tanacetum cinerariifolium]
IPLGGIPLYDLPKRREDDEFVQLWLSQFAPKKNKQIFATDIAEKLVHSTKVDFMFEVNFLMLFANVMGKADTMQAFVNLSVVRRIHEDTNIDGIDWCDFIYRCLAISHEPNTVSDFYNGPLCFLIYLEIEDEAFGKLEFYGEWSENETVEAEGFVNMLQPAIKNWSTKNMTTRHYLEIEDEAFGKLEFYGEWSENETVEETVLLEEAKAHKAPQNVKPKPAAVNTKEAAKKPKPAAVNTKEAAEKPKPAENKVPQNVKPKSTDVKTKEAAEKPKDPAGDDYQVVRAATVMKDEDREEFEVETFTQWIEGNIDWVGKFHAWPRVVELVNMVQPSTLERVISSPSKEYVKPVKPINSPYMCRRIDVTARCKRIGETVFQSLGGYRELSSVRVDMETLAPTLWIDANVIDCWVALLDFEKLALGYPTPTRHFFPTGWTLTEEEQ